MDLNLDTIKQYASIFGTGLLKQMAPGVASGFINEMVSQGHLNVAIVTKYVENNQSLWDGLAPSTRNQLSVVAKKVGNLDFITPEFFITSIKKDFSGVASLFLNWEPAMKWLTGQIEDIKSKIQE